MRARIFIFDRVLLTAITRRRSERLAMTLREDEKFFARDGLFRHRKHDLRENFCAWHAFAITRSNENGHPKVAVEMVRDIADQWASSSMPAA